KWRRLECKSATIVEAGCGSVHAHCPRGPHHAACPPGPCKDRGRRLGDNPRVRLPNSLALSRLRLMRGATGSTARRSPRTTSSWPWGSAPV
ncbi:nuclear transcription factor y subunit b-9, partial [Phtheirospermum japonicum]